MRLDKCRQIRIIYCAGTVHSLRQAQFVDFRDNRDIPFVLSRQYQIRSIIRQKCAGLHQRAYVFLRVETAEKQQVRCGSTYRFRARAISASQAFFAEARMSSVVDDDYPIRRKAVETADILP